MIVFAQQKQQSLAGTFWNTDTRFIDDNAPSIEDREYSRFRVTVCGSHFLCTLGSLFVQRQALGRGALHSITVDDIERCIGRINQLRELDEITGGFDLSMWQFGKMESVEASKWTRLQPYSPHDPIDKYVDAKRYKEAVWFSHARFLQVRWGVCRIWTGSCQRFKWRQTRTGRMSS